MRNCPVGAAECPCLLAETHMSTTSPWVQRVGARSLRMCGCAPGRFPHLQPYARQAMLRALEGSSSTIHSPHGFYVA